MRREYALGGGGEARAPLVCAGAAPAVVAEQHQCCFCCGGGGERQRVALEKVDPASRRPLGDGDGEEGEGKHISWRLACRREMLAPRFQCWQEDHTVALRGSGPDYTGCTDYTLMKTVLVGDGEVGKSLLFRQFCHAEEATRSADGQHSPLNLFTDGPIPRYLPTIGVEFGIVRVRIGETDVKLQIWDTGGQERFRAITSAYFRGAHAIVMCFDVACRTSFDNVLRCWWHLLLGSPGFGGVSPAVLLVGVTRCEHYLFRLPKALVSLAF